MGVFLAFAPFIVFAVVDRLIGSTAGLFAGAATSAVMLVRDSLSDKRSPKVLEIGTFLLFAGLACYAAFTEPEWSIIGVRLRVDAGLLLVVMFTMAIGKPFTLQYAREANPEADWNHPGFVRTNYIITGVWALAFLVMVLADLVMLAVPAVPMRVGIVATVVAIMGAYKFTGWYPKRARAGFAG